MVFLMGWKCIKMHSMDEAYYLESIALVYLRSY